MGLDNGIIVKYQSTLGDKIQGICYYDFGNGEIEVAYWRKCWNVRRAIFNAIYSDGEDYETYFDLDDLYRIIEALKGFNEENWSGDSWDDGSIWEWDEYKEFHLANIARLERLAEIMAEHPDLEAYFYDSY